MELDEDGMTRLRAEAEGGDADAIWVLRHRLKIPSHLLPKAKQPVRRFAGLYDEEDDIAPAGERDDLIASDGRREELCSVPRPVVCTRQEMACCIEHVIIPAMRSIICLSINSDTLVLVPLNLSIMIVIERDVESFERIRAIVVQAWSHVRFGQAFLVDTLLPAVLI